MRKLLDRLNVIARWRARREREQHWREEEQRTRDEEERILSVFFCRPGEELERSQREADILDLRWAIRLARRDSCIDLRTKDILVTLKVNLPPRLWLHRKHTDEAKRNMSAAQRKRRKAAEIQADLEALKEAELLAQEEVSHQ